MSDANFPGWFGASLYGGFGCAILSATVIAAWAVWRRRGVSAQVVAALLACLIASALDLGPLLWGEYRLDVYGPTLAVAEVGAALTVTALVGWAAPLTAMCWYILFAAPVAAPLALGGAQPLRLGQPAPRLDDPARLRTALPGGAPWGTLTPLARSGPLVGGVASAPPTLSLVNEALLIGREPDSDIVLDDERVSRRHAELRWERGRVALVDFGSLNGTRVNQQAARGHVPLRDGDIIELGATRYRLTLLAASPASAAASETDASEEPETRKTASASGAYTLGGPTLRLRLAAPLAGAPTEGWSLVAPLTTIGRDAGCGVVLADPSISRMHAQITRQPAGYFVADLNSSNGVLLNAERLTGPAQVFAGDTLTLGEVTLRCEETPPHPTRATTPPAASAAGETLTETPILPPEPAEARAYATPLPALRTRSAPGYDLAQRAASRHISRPRLAPAPLAEPVEPTSDGEQPPEPPIR